MTERPNNHQTDAGDVTIAVPKVEGDRTMRSNTPDAANDRTVRGVGMRPPTGVVDFTVNADAGDQTIRSNAPKAVSGKQSDGFLLNGRFYRKVKCISDSSGEAQVFLVECEDKEYVLKVYYPNFDVNKKLIQVIHSFDFEMIVNVFDFGKTYVEGKLRNYELMEYLRGGTLDKFHLGGDINTFRRIALQAAAALAYCHNNNILHKDIKPGNYFFRDEEHTELVLGDFGISSMLEKDGKSHRTSQARTPIYAAPEMYSDVIDGVVELTPAADFYSLGITLFALWIGENPLSSNERIMMRQKNEGRLPRLNELPDQVRNIVQGLTVVNPMSRWGYDEVEKWFLGEEVAVDISSPFLRYKSFIVDPDRNVVADNVHELIPLLIDNERLAVGYLYNGRISQWLESCGNTKLATVVKDIVVNRYPVDQHAGLMASVYAMEPTFPYKDVKGNLCDDIHSVAISLLSYQDEYAVLLKNPNDNLFLYLEAHGQYKIDRLRSYFSSVREFDPHVSLLRLVYEIDKEIPFLHKYPSATLKEIVKSFGCEQLTEDDWHSLTDGRLLSWMYCHEDVMACESLRIMTRDQEYSQTLAYKVLYNMERSAAYDLREVDTPEKVAIQLNNRLKNAEHMTDDEFAQEFDDIADADGRFVYYAQLHGWMEALAARNHCFDMNSEENTQRLSAYDLKTAAYRFCKMMGVTPVYQLPDGTELPDGRQMEGLNKANIRSEMRNGSLTQWLSVFYHEDPDADFSANYSYEHSLEEWIMVLGSFDESQRYYKRFITAREETQNKMDGVKRGWSRAKRKENTWRYTFYGLAALFILLTIFVGVTGRDFMLRHSFITMGIPLGGASALIVSTRAYFKGYGFMLSVLWGLVGALSAAIPIFILKYLNGAHPEWFDWAIVIMTLVYMLICHLTDFRGDSKVDTKLVNEVFDDDIQSTLLEPLYYTFKTKSFRFKGSKFGMLDDVSDQIRSISGESVLHYIMWSGLMALLVAEFVIFSPKLLNVRNPYLDNNWKLQPHQVIKQLEKDVE